MADERSNGRGDTGDAAAKAPIIDVRNIVKQFGSVIALSGVSMSVSAGEVLCLLGDNGAGKSTLIKTLSGVHRPTSGEFYVDGKPVVFESPRDALDAGIALARASELALDLPNQRALVIRRNRIGCLDDVGELAMLKFAGKLQPPLVQKPGAVQNGPDSNSFWRKLCVAGQPLSSHRRVYDCDLSCD